MKRWWKRLAACAAWLGLAAAGASAQTMSPSPVGAARMPEPVRYDPGPMPNLVPGPITPELAPAGPGPGLDLNARHSNAFPVEKFSVEEAVYFNVGGQFLRRQRVEPLPVVYVDQGVPFDNFPRTAETLPLTGSANQALPPYRIGPRATLGYLFGNHGVEVSGFYLPESSGTSFYQSQGRLTADFSMPFGVPLFGFEGNGNSIWEKADQMRITFKSAVAGAEANYRAWNGGLNQLEMIVGLRYMYLGEQLDIFAHDDGLTRDGFGRTDATLAATYRSRVMTNFAGVQVGSEYSYMLPYTREVVWLHAMGKAAFGANHITRTMTLSRGDGLVAFRVQDDKIQAGGLFDIQAGLDFHLLDKMRLRFAYQAFWLAGTTTPTAQVDYRLEQQGSQAYGYKTIMYHGPQMELWFLF
jgi:hypothetical protein